MALFMETDEVSTLSGPVRVFEVCPLGSGEASADNGLASPIMETCVLANLDRVLGPHFGPCLFVNPITG